MLLEKRKGEFSRSLGQGRSENQKWAFAPSTPIGHRTLFSKCPVECEKTRLIVVHTLKFPSVPSRESTSVLGTQNNFRSLRAQKKCLARDTKVTVTPFHCVCKLHHSFYLGVLISFKALQTSSHPRQQNSKKECR